MSQAAKKMKHNEHWDAYLNKPWLRHYAPGVANSIGVPTHPSLGSLITDTCRKYGNLKAYTLCLPNGLGGSLTFTEVEEHSNAFASYLRNVLQIKPGTRVAIQLPNCLSYPIAAFGVFKAGCILVNINPLYTPRETLHSLTDSGAEVLVVADIFAGPLAQVLPPTQVRAVVTCRVGDLCPKPITYLVQFKMFLDKKLAKVEVPYIPFLSALEVGAKSFSNDQEWYQQGQGKGEKPISHGDVALLQYTGGTTGVSKGAELTHGNLLYNTCQILEYGKPKLVSAKETILTVLPLYHIFAFTVNGLTFFRLGANNVLIPNPRPPKNLAKAIEKHPITWITGVNTLLNALCHEKWFTQSPPKHLKMTIVGGAALHQKVAENWVKVARSPVAEGFGMTESSPVVCFNPIGGDVRPNCIGLPMPNTDVAIVDDNGHPVPLGEPGEIIVRGPQVMKGYWKRPEETAKTIKDGWLYTGDVGIMDKDGYLRIVDRKKDMILVSGFNVYPNEVEDCLTQHPGVLEAAVVGQVDENAGELVKAFVVRRDPNLSSEALREHCKKLLAGYKVPKIIEFRTELPKTPIGKILRRELRT